MTTTSSWLHSDRESLSQEFKGRGGAVFARYLLEGSDEKKAIETGLQIASGQTLGFMPKDDSLKDWCARLLAVSQRTPNRWEIFLGFPGHLFDREVGSILTLCFGKYSFVPDISLIQVDADTEFLQRYNGPRWGSEGVRKIIDCPASDIPLMAILKPGIGPIEFIRNGLQELIGSGVRLIKDDEVCIDATFDVTRKRADVLSSCLTANTLFLMHLTGPAFELQHRAQTLVRSHGVRGLLFCPYTYGIGILQALTQDPLINVPIFAHPAFTGPMMNGPSSTRASVVLGTLLRWAGSEGVLYPSPYGSVRIPLEEAQGIHSELTKSALFKASASIPSAGIEPRHVHEMRHDFAESIDLVINAGTGFTKGFASIAEGVTAFRREIDKK